MIEIGILVKNEKGELSLQKVSGYKLPNSLFAHKDDLGKWRVSDYDSGSLVQGGFDSFKDLNNTVKSPDFIQLINKVRKEDKYQRLLNKRKELEGK